MKNALEKTKKEKMMRDMDEVIRTSSYVRDELLSKEKKYEEKASELEFFKQVIAANKNIVSATIVEISCQKLANYEGQ